MVKTLGPKCRQGHGLFNRRIPPGPRRLPQPGDWGACERGCANPDFLSQSLPHWIPTGTETLTQPCKFMMPQPLDGWLLIRSS